MQYQEPYSLAAVIRYTCFAVASRWESWFLWLNLLKMRRQGKCWYHNFTILSKLLEHLKQCVNRIICSIFRSLLYQYSVSNINGACGWVVKALNLISRNLGSDSHSAGHVLKPWTSFESTLPLATQQYCVNGFSSRKYEKKVNERVPIPGCNWCKICWTYSNI